MFWSKKEDEEGLPDLPISPRMTQGIKRGDDFGRLPFSSEEEIHSLPSFPDSPTDKGFSQSAIKDAVTTEEELPSLPEFGDEDIENLASVDRPQDSEMEEWRPRPLPEPLEWKPKNLPVTRGSRHIKEEIVRPSLDHVARNVPDKPIFIKLDKFKSARNSLEVVKQKVDEIEDLLKTIREVKRKEDSELSAWENEMESIKTRINHVTNELFEKFYT
jgi:hypothetical protein